MRGPLELLGGLAFGVAGGALCVAAFPTPPPQPQPDHAELSTPASPLDVDVEGTGLPGKSGGSRSGNGSASVGWEAEEAEGGPGAEGGDDGVPSAQDTVAQRAGLHPGPVADGEGPAPSCGAPPEGGGEECDEEHGRVDAGGESGGEEGDGGASATEKAEPAAGCDSAPEGDCSSGSGSGAAAETGLHPASVSEGEQSDGEDGGGGGSAGDGGGQTVASEPHQRAALRAGALMAMGLFAVLGGKAVHYAGGGALAVIVMGAVAGRVWAAPAVAEAKVSRPSQSPPALPPKPLLPLFSWLQAVLSSAWTLVAQPLLFVLIGAAVSTAHVEGSFVGAAAIRGDRGRYAAPTLKLRAAPQPKAFSSSPAASLCVSQPLSHAWGRLSFASASAFSSRSHGCPKPPYRSDRTPGVRTAALLNPRPASFSSTGRHRKRSSGHRARAR